LNFDLDTSNFSKDDSKVKKGQPLDPISKTEVPIVTGSSLSGTKNLKYSKI